MQRQRTVPIAIAEIIGGEKSEFYADLRNSLDLSRRAANKSVTECVRQDADLMTGGTCPKLYTYPIISTSFPGVAAVAASIARNVEAKYRQERWAVGRGLKRVCNYRSFPWPLLCNKSTQMLIISDEGQFLSAKIKILGGWWKVRLAGGSNYRDQVRCIRYAIEFGKVGDSRIRIDRKHRAILNISVALPKVTT